MTSISIVGGETPLGREVRDRISASPMKARISLLGAAAGKDIVLTEDEGEPAVLPPLDPDALKDSDVVFCCANPEATRAARKLAGGALAPPFIDLTHGLEGLPEARLRSPLTEGATGRETDSNVSVIASPAASALALLLLRIQTAYPVRMAVAQIFEPASERGGAALAELQQQVGALLSFKRLEKKIFDAQLAFSLLAKYGEDAPLQLGDVEARVERHLATLLAARVAMPSLRLTQAPVFHGHTFSVWLELESRPEMEDLMADLESPQIEVRGADTEAPSNSGVAGHSGVTVGPVEADRNHPRGVWLFAASDNYRIMADDAVAVAQQILAGAPS